MATTASTTKKTTARKSTAKKAPAKKATAKKAPAKKSTATTARKRTTAAAKKTTAAAKPAVTKVQSKPAAGKVAETRGNLLALLPFELPKFELPFELPKFELPKLDEVQSRVEDFVIDLRERTNSGEIRKSVETAVEKVRASVGR